MTPTSRVQPSGPASPTFPSAEFDTRGAVGGADRVANAQLAGPECWTRGSGVLDSRGKGGA